jgi:hypothetical protein
MFPFNTIGVAVGARGTGKTPLVVGGDWEQGMAKTYLQKNMSVLILDTIDHPKYRQIVTPIMPGRFGEISGSGKVYRCLFSANDAQAVIFQLKRVWNTLIVFEDCYKYMAKELSKIDKAVIGDSKQQNNDVLYMFSCWKYVISDICKNCDYYIVFKTLDKPKYRHADLGGCYDNIERAYNNVMKGKEHYYCVRSGV